ncbi:MAG: sugar phosphate isomerase/epimerase [bacterium]|nr:sugar phosphate isomerase/epimerase [bacterium]
MKMSFCTIAFRHRPMYLEDMIFIISKLGYNGIEIWGNHLRGYETSLGKIRKILKERKLKVSMISPHFDFTNNYRRWTKSIEDAKKFIAFSVELNCPLIRCFTGQIGSEYATRSQWENGVKGIRHLAELAQKEGITIGIETHPNTLADTTIAVLKLLDEIKMENVKIILDFYNMWETEKKDPIDVLNLLYSHTVHIHAKNADVRKGKISPFNYVIDKNRKLESIRPLGKGDLNYKIILKELLKRGYKSYISVECFETERNPLWVAEEEILFIKESIKDAKVK